VADIIPIRGHALYSRQTKRSAAGVLRTVRRLNPAEILVIGTDEEGHLFVQGSPPDPANAMWLMELAKRKLCAADDNG